MSVEVTIEYWPQIWIGPNQDAWYNHNFGSPPNNNHWIRFSSSPDNFPSSIQIVEEWFWTDTNNSVHAGIHWRNNSAAWVGFRPKVVIAPHEDWD
jgi:hypothetical protein